MNLPGAFTRELWSVAGFGLLLLLIGLIAGHPSLLLLLGAAGYLGWHFFNVLRLVHWLTVGRRFRPPDAPGIWSEVYYQIYRLQQRHRKRKRKLVGMLDRYQETAAILPDATVVLGPRGECEWWNDTAVTLLGLRSPQDVGQRIDNLVRFPAFTRYLASGDYSDRVVVASPVDHRVMLAIRIVPYGRDQRLLVARDVTQVERQEEIRRDFVANVSHELRTPLTVISGFVETLLDSDETRDEHWQRPLQQVQQQARRMQRIVDDLLFLARLEGQEDRGRDTPVDVPKLLAALRDEAQTLSGAGGHAISLDADAGLQLLGHEDELRSAFSNLVFNAVQYTPAGGAIDIRWYRDASGAHLAVRDNGAGIPAHHIPRLTERFYRVDIGRSRERGGTGLGLAIVKHVLQRHDAQLTIRSELGKGSVFSCDFPPDRAVSE